MSKPSMITRAFMWSVTDRYSLFDVACITLAIGFFRDGSFVLALCAVVVVAFVSVPLKNMTRIEDAQ